MRTVLLRGYRSNKARSKKKDHFTHVSLVFTEKHKTYEFQSVPGKGAIKNIPCNCCWYSEFVLPFTDGQVLDAYLECVVVSEEGSSHRNNKDPIKTKYKWGAGEFVSHILQVAGLRVSKVSPHDTPGTICKRKGLVEVR